MTLRRTVSSRFSVWAVAAAALFSLPSVTLAQQVVGDGAQGTVRSADFLNGVDLLNVRTTSSSSTYTIDGYGTPPTLFQTTSAFVSQNPQTLRLNINPAYFAPGSIHRPSDPTEFMVNDYAVFTPSDGMGTPTGASPSYINVTAHVVAPAIGYDSATLEALSKRTIPYGTTVTVPIHLSNASNAVDDGSNTLGTKADLTVSRMISTLGVSGYNTGNGTAYDTTNSEVTVNGPVNGSTFVLTPQQANNDYSVSITPVRDATRPFRIAQFNLTTDTNSSFGTVDGNSAIGIQYFVPTIVAAHSTQSSKALGGSGNTGGVDATFTSNAGGDFAVDYSVADPNTLPPGHDFQVAGGIAQRWDISYNGTIDPSSPITLTFNFDASMLTDSERMNVVIEHYVAARGAYEVLPVVSRGYNTITVTTTSFSPFVLAVPEPAAVLSAASAVVLLARRRAGNRPRSGHGRLPNEDRKFATASQQFQIRPVTSGGRAKKFNGK